MGAIESPLIDEPHFHLAGVVNNAWLVEGSDEGEGA